MDEAQVQQIVDELLSSLEPLETQSSALLQFLKAKGFATDEELAPFLDQAGNTANVRWRAVKVRIAALISSAMKPSEQSSESSATKGIQIQTKSLEGEENAQNKQIDKTGRKNVAEKQETETAPAPMQRADETTMSGPSIPESDEAPKDNRSTDFDAPEVPDKNDTREAA